MITIENLTKKFDKTIAVDSISLKIFEGEVFGLLGQNGAGKTTIIHMLATLLKPSSGTAKINGYDIVRDPSKVRSNIGIVFQAPSSDDMLTGYENLKIHSILYKVPKKDRKERILTLLELVGLKERKDDLVKTYSGGMRRRLEIARGLLHKPKVIFLDEPTLGLDPNSRKSMWKYIQKLSNEEKITTILTTHYMDEVDVLCDRIAFIHKGRIIETDSPEKLKNKVKQLSNNQKYNGDYIQLNFKRSLDSDILLTNLKILKSFEFIRKIKKNIVNNRCIMDLYVEDINYNLPTILKSIDQIESVEFSKFNMDDVFYTLTDGQTKEQAEGGFMERYAKYDKKNQ